MLRVLVVDDDPDVLASLVAVLEAMPEDFEVVKASSAQEALEILSHLAVNVILTDYQMPGMNGLELLENAEGRYPGGAILMTAYPRDAEANLAARKGLLRRFMRKPGNPEALQQMVRELLFPVGLGDAQRGS